MMYPMGLPTRPEKHFAAEPVIQTLERQILLQTRSLWGRCSESEYTLGIAARRGTGRPQVRPATGPVTGIH